MLYFANSADFEKYADMTAPDNADRLLRLASGWVKHAVRRAQFDVAPSGMPTDPDIVDALRDATCEQVLVWVQNGVEPGKVDRRGAVSSSSIGDGSVSFETASVVAARAEATTALCDTALTILEEADLVGWQPWTR